MTRFKKDPTVDAEIQIGNTDNCEIFHNVKDLKGFVDTLEYIDQPINTRLSSILQMCCQYAHDDETITYLLEHGANPKYLDIDCHDAQYYANQNEDTLAGLMCLNTLWKYVDHFPTPDVAARKQIGFDLIKSEIARHKQEVEDEQKKIEEFLSKCNSLGESNGN